MAATLVTAGFLYGQLTQAREQTRIFREQADQAKQDAAAQLAVTKNALAGEQDRFVDDERPYLWESNTIEANQPQMVTNQAVYWNWHYTNYGKTPAIGVAGREQVIWGPNAKSQLIKNFFNPIHKSNDKSGIVIPPTRDMYSSAHTINHNPTAADIQWIKSHSRGIMMVAYFEYFDRSGNMYKSTICKMRLESGAIADCDIFTDIH